MPGSLTASIVTGQTLVSARGGVNDGRDEMGRAGAPSRGDGHGDLRQHLDDVTGRIGRDSFGPIDGAGDVLTVHNARRAASPTGARPARRIRPSTDVQLRPTVGQPQPRAHSRDQIRRG